MNGLDRNKNLNNTKNFNQQKPVRALSCVTIINNEPVELLIQTVLTCAIKLSISQ